MDNNRKRICMGLSTLVILELLACFLLNRKVFQLICNINLYLICMSVLAGFTIICINQIINKLILKKTDKNPSDLMPKKNIVQNIRLNSNVISWTLFIFASCYLEEIFFRFYLLEWIAKLSNYLVASIVSSIFFTMIHFNYLQIVQIFIMGILFAFLYIETNNIIYPVVAHFTNNFAIYLIQYREYYKTNNK
jgi:membrane protease YdiL (CAAX protease family)